MGVIWGLYRECEIKEVNKEVAERYGKDTANIYKPQMAIPST